MRWGEFLFQGIYSYLPNLFFTLNYAHFLVNHNESTFNDMRVTLVYCRILHDHAKKKKKKATSSKMYWVNINDQD